MTKKKEKKKFGHGGFRIAGPGKRVGRPKGDRVDVSTTLGLGEKEFCKKYAEDNGLPGWGHTVSEALALLKIYNKYGKDEFYARLEQDLAEKYSTN